MNGTKPFKTAHLDPHRSEIFFFLLPFDFCFDLPRCYARVRKIKRLHTHATLHQTTGSEFILLKILQPTFA